MMKNKELKIVYTGSVIDAGFIKSYLEDNGISSLMKDEYRQSIIAGWVSPGSENSVKVYVQKKDFEKASILVKEYLNSIDGVK